MLDESNMRLILSELVSHPEAAGNDPAVYFVTCALFISFVCCTIRLSLYSCTVLQYSPVVIPVHDNTDLRSGKTPPHGPVSVASGPHHPACTLRRLPCPHDAAPGSLAP